MYYKIAILYHYNKNMGLWNRGDDVILCSPVRKWFCSDGQTDMPGWNEDIVGTLALEDITMAGNGCLDDGTI